MFSVFYIACLKGYTLASLNTILVVEHFFLPFRLVIIKTMYITKLISFSVICSFCQKGYMSQIGQSISLFFFPNVVSVSVKVFLSLKNIQIQNPNAKKHPFWYFHGYYAFYECERVLEELIAGNLCKILGSKEDRPKYSMDCNSNIM